MARHSAGSLTKEFPLDSIENTILHITPGMAFDALRTFADTHTNSNIPPILRNRYLLVRDDGRIVYDELLSLIAAEGIKSARVRKVMYFLWAFRDNRIREFVLGKLANAQGLWRPAEVTRKSNASFFSTYVEAATTLKVRSNFERFLVETGIFNEGTRTVHLELADNWLVDAMRVAAQHEINPLQRRLMLANPSDFLINKGWQGLVNATTEVLRGLPPIVNVSPDPLEDTPLERTTTAGKSWNRTKPTVNEQQTASRSTNPVALERAYASHHLLESILAAAVRALGKDPLFNEHIDMYVLPGTGSILIEVKSCQTNNLHAQVRRGISQLLEYRYFYRDVLVADTTMLLVLETRPTNEQAWLIKYAETLGIVIAWKESAGNRVLSSANLPGSLAGLVHVA